jgi:hypothetical protein
MATALIAACSFGLGLIFGATYRRDQIAELKVECAVWRELATELHEEGARLRLFSLATRRGQR